MDYFSFYDLPMSFMLDISILRNKFLHFSRIYHPDFYINATEEKQAEILQLATFNNKAYKTLSDFDLRMQYVLQIEGYMQEDEKYQLPQTFLFEMMEINEKIEFVAQDADKKNEVDVYMQQIKSNLDQEINDSLITFNKATATSEIYEKIKLYYFKKKYLLRIQEQLDKFVLPK